MRVGRADSAAIGASDMRDGDGAADGMVAQSGGERRLRARPLLAKDLAIATVVESDAPAVAVPRRRAGPPHQPGKAEAEIGRHVGAHSQKFAHGNAAFQAAGRTMSGAAMDGWRLRIEVSMSHRHGPTEVIRGALAFGVAAQAALQIPRIPHGGPDRGKNDNTYKCDVNISIIT